MTDEISYDGGDGKPKFKITGRAAIVTLGVVAIVLIFLRIL